MTDPAARALPSRWDGVAVEWTEWEAGQVFLCPPPRPRPCPGCGLIRPRSSSRGKRRRPRHIGYYSSLFAYRCSGCGRDEVHEMGTDDWWVLDDSDYGPDGSWAGAQ